jgi:hypothetical protein
LILCCEWWHQNWLAMDQPASCSNWIATIQHQNNHKTHARKNCKVSSMGLASSQVQAYNLISMCLKNSQYLKTAWNNYQFQEEAKETSWQKITGYILTSVKSRQKVIIALNITEKCNNFDLTQYQNSKALIKQLPCTAYKCCLNN